MSMIRTIITALFISIIAPGNCIPGDLSAQLENDRDFILQSRYAEQPVAHKSEETSETKLMAMGSIRLYQILISSQDVPACNFYPSCSRFTARAMARGGLLKGGLVSADRLMRCHWLSKPQGIVDSLSAVYFEKIYDPVGTYLR